MKSRYDVFLAVLVFTLLLFGTVMILSTSAVFAELHYSDSFFFFKNRLLHLTIGSLALIAGAAIDYHRWEKLILGLMVLMLVLLVGVLIPEIGHEVKGGRRWLRLLGFSFQPAELLKIVLIFYVASYLQRKQEVMTSFFRGLTPNFIVLGIYLFLVLLQPDFGTVVLISLTVLLMVYIGGARSLHIFGSLLACSVIAGFLIVSQTYRIRRLLAFLNPWEDPLDSGFQIIQSFIALGSGGWFGRGFWDGRQKLFFLPDAHTDFIFAILGEELGFFGVCLLVLLFALFIWRGYMIAWNAQDAFGKYLAFGITTSISLQIILNLFVVTGMLPTKGLPLPFISAGGTSLVTTLFMTGILLNVSSSTGQKNVSVNGLSP